MVIAFFVATNIYSQDKYLSISNAGSDKISVFKENKRVRVRTIQGGKINGKLQIIDDNQIMIGKVIVPISSIAKIKQNPVLLNVIVSGTLLVIGVAGVVGGLVILAWSVEAFAAIPILLGAGSFTGGILSPNILKGTKILNSTTIKVGTVME